MMEVKRNWYKLYHDDIKRNGGYEEYYNKKIKYRENFIKKVKKYATSKKVLEAGCGTGVLPIRLAIDDYISYAVDIDNKMLKILNKISRCVTDKKVIAINNDIFTLSSNFKEKELDVIYSIGVFEHFDDEKIRKLLKEEFKIAKYVFVGIPTTYFNSNEKLYGNERFLKLSYWRKILMFDNYKIIEEFSCYNGSVVNRIKNYKKWFRPAPIYVFVLEEKDN